jgi:hypothetical protein
MKMAKKRMFNIKITDSDAFLDMPLSTQCLYFHLNMHADDDGFIGNPKKISRMIGASEDDLKLLIMKRFVITFEDSVLVIKHWLIHNTLRKDRYQPTIYTDEKERLGVKENNAYTLDMSKSIKKIDAVSSLATKWQPTVAADIDIDIDIDIDKDIYIPPTQKHKHGNFKHVLLTDKEYDHLVELYGSKEIVDEHIQILDEYIETSGKKYKNHSLVIQKWVHAEWTKRNKNKPIKLDSKFYTQENTQSEEDLQKELNRVREEILNKGGS